MQCIICYNFNYKMSYNWKKVILQVVLFNAYIIKKYYLYVLLSTCRNIVFWKQYYSLNILYYLSIIKLLHKQEMHSLIKYQNGKGFGFLQIKNNMYDSSIQNKRNIIRLPK